MKLGLLITNKGMSDAIETNITLKLNDANDKVIERSIDIENIPARSSLKLNVELKDISREVIDAFLEAISYSFVTEGRIGISIDYEIAGKEPSSVYLPMSDDSRSRLVLM